MATLAAVPPPSPTEVEHTAQLLLDQQAKIPAFHPIKKRTPSLCTKLMLSAADRIHLDAIIETGEGLFTRVFPLKEQDQSTCA